MVGKRNRFEVFKIGSDEYAIDEEAPSDTSSNAPRSYFAPDEHDKQDPLPKDTSKEMGKAIAHMPVRYLDESPPLPNEGVMWRLCKDERCTMGNEGTPKIFRVGGAHLGARARRLFCSARCAHNYHAREYGRRVSRGTAGWWLEKKGGQQYRFAREKPTTATIADFRYYAHKDTPKACPNSSEDTNWKCPGNLDPYSRNPELRCLIYATLVEDAKEWRAKKRSELYERQWTTHDGQWKEDQDLLS